MLRDYLCSNCGSLHQLGHVCPRLDSIVPARMPEQSNPKALAGDSSVPCDSTVSDLASMTYWEIEGLIYRAHQELRRRKAEAKKANSENSTATETR